MIPVSRDSIALLISDLPDAKGKRSTIPTVDSAKNDNEDLQSGMATKGETKLINE